MITRLPASHVFHATSLQKPCLRPLLYRAAYPESAPPPGSLNAMMGTLGHAILADLHRGVVDSGSSAVEFSRMFEDRVDAVLPDLLDPDIGTDFGDGSGRKTWLLEDPAEIRTHIETEGPGQGQILLNYVRWWRQNVDPDLTKGILAVEVPYHLEIPSKGESYLVEGMVDLVFSPKPDVVILGDWKFGSMVRSQLSQGMLDMDFQLATYSLAMLRGALTNVPARVPTQSALFLMEDLLPYERKTALSVPRFPTDARANWITYWSGQGKTHWLPGDLRGPLFHPTTFTEDALLQQEREMKARMAATRTGGALVRVRGEHCLFCNSRQLCLEDWKRPKGVKDDGKDDDSGLTDG